MIEFPEMECLDVLLIHQDNLSLLGEDPPETAELEPRFIADQRAPRPSVPARSRSSDFSARATRTAQFGFPPAPIATHPRRTLGAGAVPYALAIGRFPAG